jgi:hypothetical protein
MQTSQMKRTKEGCIQMAVDPSQIRPGEMGMYVDGGDAGDGIIDVDATVGGKRKR